MSENYQYQYAECKHCGKSVMEGEIHSCLKMLLAEIDDLRRTNSDLATAAICPDECQPEHVRRKAIEDCIAAIDGLPARIEPISGQYFTYVKRREAIAAMRQLEI